MEGWDPALRAHVQRLEATKPVVLCGDLNVAHRDEDIWHVGTKSKKSPAAMAKFSALTPQERASFGVLLEGGLVDSFRHFHGDAKGWYTWWSTKRATSRPDGKGLRIDYFLVTKALLTEGGALSVHDSWMLDEVPFRGQSDHAPIALRVSL